MIKNITFFVLMILSVNLFAQEKVEDFENLQIILDNGFAGESMTLVKENGNFYIIRKVFGSGIPVVSTIKYKVKFSSAYQIEFSEVVTKEGKLRTPDLNEHFKLTVNNGQLSLYINDLKLETKITLHNNGYK